MLAPVMWPNHPVGSLGRMETAALTFASDGFEVFPGVLDHAECDQLSALVPDTANAGSRRLLSEVWCRSFAARLKRDPRLSQLLPQHSVAVQCTYFSKSPYSNWLVAPHQDLSIPVANRVEFSGCSGWSEKEGLLFTQPPISVLEQLVALRVHLDECWPDSGPLIVAPASHLRGRLTGGFPIPSHACLVPRGGVLAIRPLLVHASSKLNASVPRRVLHFLFGPAELPYGLRWADAV